MITRTNAVKMSIKKWGQYPVNLKAKCGFCEFEKYKIYICNNCPLYPDICGDWDSLYSKYENNPTVELQQQILSAIKERGEKWIKEGKKVRVENEL